MPATPQTVTPLRAELNLHRHINRMGWLVRDLLALSLSERAVAQLHTDTPHWHATQNRGLNELNDSNCGSRYLLLSLMGDDGLAPSRPDIQHGAAEGCSASTAPCISDQSLLALALTLPRGARGQRVLHQPPKVYDTAMRFAGLLALARGDEPRWPSSWMRPQAVRRPCAPPARGWSPALGWGSS